MTVSVQTRKDNAAQFLRTLMAEIDDLKRAFRDVWCTPSEYSEILPTTWKELESTGYIVKLDSAQGIPRYSLTGRGWLAGLRLTGQYENNELMDRLIRLRAGLKDSVKGRSDDAYVWVHSFAEVAGLPEEWIINVVDSGLLERKFPNDKVHLEWSSYRDAGRMIRVPQTFGMESINLEF